MKRKKRKVSKRKTASAHSRRAARLKRSFEVSLIPKKQYPLTLLVMLFIMVVLFLALLFSQGNGRLAAGRAADVVIGGEISSERWQSCAALMLHIKSHYYRYDRRFASGDLSGLRDFNSNSEDQLYILDLAGFAANQESFSGSLCNEVFVAFDSSGDKIRFSSGERDSFVYEVCEHIGFGCIKGIVDSYVQCAEDDRLCGDIELSSGVRQAILEDGSGREILARLNRLDSEGYCEKVE